MNKLAISFTIDKKPPNLADIEEFKNALRKHKRKRTIFWIAIAVGLLCLVFLCALIVFGIISVNVENFHANMFGLACIASACTCLCISIDINDNYNKQLKLLAPLEESDCPYLVGLAEKHPEINSYLNRLQNFILPGDR